tara:strand:- start:369 stop:497 length:129 start_codon:yes stop_codon:yes gene_type:complete
MKRIKKVSQEQRIASLENVVTKLYMTLNELIDKLNKAAIKED